MHTLSRMDSASPQPVQADSALVLEGLCKAFGQKIAVNMLSLVVPVGSIYGVVGPNGAGKTTTLSMATGLLLPDAGRASVHGIDVWAQPIAAKAQLGVLPDGLRTFDRLTASLQRVMPRYASSRLIASWRSLRIAPMTKARHPAGVTRLDVFGPAALSSIGPSR